MPYLIKRICAIMISISALMHNSCNQHKQSQPSEVMNTFVPQQSGCYQLIIKEDTAHLQLNIKDKNISGKLDYKRKEKDSNTGTFTGTVVNDTLDMMYAFMSEGIISHRQIKMINVKDGLAEGYGELKVSNDTAFFKYPNGLQFETNHLYKKIKCP